MPITFNGTTASVTGLTNGTSYRFRVAARNAVGLGPYTASTTPGSPSGQPPPPPPPGVGESWSLVAHQSANQIFNQLGLANVTVANNRLYDIGRFSPTLAGIPGGSLQSTLTLLEGLAPLYSTDGVSWTEGSGFWRGRAISGGSGYIGWVPGTVIYGNSLYVGVGDETGEHPGNIDWGYSSDGQNWSSSLNVAGQLSALAAPTRHVRTAVFDGYRFVASSLYSPTAARAIIHSTDGASWSIQQNAYLAALGGGNGLYIAPVNGSLGNFYRLAAPVAGSVVPSTFTSTNLPIGAQPFYGGATAGWIATTATGTYYTSSDGAAWTARSLPGAYRPAVARRFFSPVAYGSNTWLMLAYSGTGSTAATQYRSLLRSSDGITWTVLTTLPVVATWSHIQFYSGYFYAGAIAFGKLYRAQ